MGKEVTKTRREHLQLLAWVLWVTAGLVGVLGVLMEIVAVWTVGSNSGRWGGTGLIVIVLALCIGVAGSVAYDESTRRPRGWQ